MTVSNAAKSSSRSGITPTKRAESEVSPALIKPEPVKRQVVVLTSGDFLMSRSMLAGSEIRKRSGSPAPWSKYPFLAICRWPSWVRIVVSLKPSKEKAMNPPKTIIAAEAAIIERKVIEVRLLVPENIPEGDIECVHQVIAPSSR